jgi:hypothetical protein
VVPVHPLGTLVGNNVFTGTSSTLLGMAVATVRVALAPSSGNVGIANVERVDARSPSGDDRLLEE